MDLQSFIQSGLLESYVLGQATAEERSLVERMLIQHPEAQAEMAAIERALESYAQALSTAPPSWMKGRILDQIAQQSAPLAPMSAPALTSYSPVMLRTFQLAALALLLAGVFFWNQNRQLRTDNTSQQAQLADCSRRSENQDRLFAMLQDTATRIVTLKSTSQDASAMVYNNPNLGETLLNTASIKAPNHPKVYFQFWAIVNNKPVNMGMVQMNPTGGWQKLPYMENAVAFAISAEDKPEGNPTPTTVVMSGKLNS